MLIGHDIAELAQLNWINPFNIQGMMLANLSAMSISPGVHLLGPDSACLTSVTFSTIFACSPYFLVCSMIYLAIYLYHSIRDRF
jgi:hypothetical protein